MEFSLGILVCVVGMALLVWALVRPRKGDEPHCRRCRFSLAGLTGPARCPECGAELARTRAIVKGHRPSPRRAACWFVGLSLTGGVLIGLDAMNRTGFFPLTTYKPAFVLQLEAYLLGDLRASMATDELVDRITKGELGQGEQDRLVRTALARHAQIWRVFPDAQWDVLLKAMWNAELTIDQVELLWQDCISSIEVISGERLTQEKYSGEIVEVSVGIRYRAGMGANIQAYPIFTNEMSLAVEIENSDGVVLLANRARTIAGDVVRGTEYISATNGSRVQYDDVIAVSVPSPSSVGEYTLRVLVNCDMAETFMVRDWDVPGSDAEQRLHKVKLDRSVPFRFEVVDAYLLGPSPVAREDIRAFNGSEEPIKFDVDLGGLKRQPPFVYFSVGTSPMIPRNVGIGGYLVFEQGANISKKMIVYENPHTQSKDWAKLAGFVPGIVQVRYEYDPDIARDHRHLMSRVLGGTIELGTITIPEPE